MTRRSKLWMALAAVFTLVNVGGVGIAAVRGEWLHTAVHVALMFIGTYAVWRLTPWGRGQDVVGVHSGNDHLEQLEQSVDAIALEVERIGEAQRFMVKLQQERTESER